MPTTDLTNCDREPIHIPGSVQPHGVLLVISEPDLRIVQMSENAAGLLGRKPDELLGQSLDLLLTPEVMHFWRRQVLVKRLDGNPQYLSPFDAGGRLLEGSIHRHDGVLLLQLEPRNSLEHSTSMDIFSSSRMFLSDLQSTRSLAEFAQVAASSIRENTGYDRVMIYRFLEDGSGEVIGESKREDLNSWMGLRYPESDIPRQARALYLKSWLRVIVDVDAPLATMIPDINPVTGMPLDMSYCVLRSVSPIHLQYLRNIGAQASMSLSLIRDEKLWGLIACHHGTPKELTHEARVACEFLAHSVSLQIGAKEDSEHSQYFSKLRDDVGRLSGFMSSDSPFYDGLLNHRPDMLSLFRAGGAAVVVEQELYLRGLTPGQDQIKSLVSWLKRQPFEEGVFVTDRLPELYPEASAYLENASGLLAIRVEQAQLQWLLWFRPEMLQMVNWAGNPSKTSTVMNKKTGLETLSPRRSFELWREEKQGLSEPWRAEEIKVAVELRRAVVEAALRRIHELQSANDALSRSNVELESFAYAAGHDLKEPLRGIQNYSQMLQRSLGEKLTEQEHQRIDMVLRLSSRMDELIDSLLDYSRVGCLELEYEEIDSQDLLMGLLAMLKPRLDAQGVTVRVPGHLRSVRGDRVRVREVFQNLIINAAKYNDKTEKWIEVGCQDDDAAAFYVRDNGIGIAPKYQQSIFQIFRRLHGPESYGGGSGAGLTIAQRIVERHGGKMWLDSIVGEGTTFYFTLGHRQA